MTLKTVDQSKYYESLTDDELLPLAASQEKVSPEARSYLLSELSRRGISHRDIAKFENDRSSTEWQDKNYTWERVYGLFPSLNRFRATIADWREYRRRTGEWPRNSIGFYFLHLTVELIAVILMVWYGVQHGWSKGKLLIIALPLLAVDVIVSSWLKEKIRLFELAHHRSAHRA